MNDSTNTPCLFELLYNEKKGVFHLKKQDITLYYPDFELIGRSYDINNLLSFVQLVNMLPLVVPSLTVKFKHDFVLRLYSQRFHNLRLTGIALDDFNTSHHAR